LNDIERLISQYASKRLSRRSFVKRLLALGVSAHFAEALVGMPLGRALAAPAPPSPARTPRIVVVVMDAFRADYQKLAPMPNLEWLMQRGTTFTNAWVGHLESMTPASHATISTGATPAHHGIIGFSWRDQDSGKEDYSAWYDGVVQGRLEEQLILHNVNSIPLAVKSSDPTARVVAVSSEKYYAADVLGGHAADYILYGLPKNHVITTLGIPHHVPPKAFLNKKTLSRPWPLKYEQYDEMSMTMALESLRAFDPRVLLINMPGCDTYGHQVGGPATPDVMRRLVAGADAQLGRLISTFRDRGILDSTIFVVTGDHGMIPNGKQIRDTVVKNQVAAAGGDLLFNTGGTSSYIWLRNPSEAQLVAQRLVRHVPHAAFAHHQTLQNGTYTYHLVMRPGEQPDPPLEAAYQYMFSTFAGPTSPDVCLWLEENTIIRNRIDGPPNAPHGNHGGASWGVQQIPLVVSGPDVKQNNVSDFRARLMDIAPTVLALLGLRPDRMDGVALSDALLKPTSSQVEASGSLATSLESHQKSIVARHDADLALTGPTYQ
jgi:arylsulfatase A-like enzyme